MAQASASNLDAEIKARVPADLMAAVDRIADRKFLKRSDIVREALRDYTKKRNSKDGTEAVPLPDPVLQKLADEFAVTHGAHAKAEVDE